MIVVAGYLLVYILIGLVVRAGVIVFWGDGAGAAFTIAYILLPIWYLYIRGKNSDTVLKGGRVSSGAKQYIYDVVGESFANEDGSSRQNIISRYARVGMPVHLKFYDYNGEIACSVHLDNPPSKQIGHISRNEVAEIYDLVTDPDIVFDTRLRSFGKADPNGLYGATVEVRTNKKREAQKPSLLVWMVIVLAAVIYYSTYTLDSYRPQYTAQEAIQKKKIKALKDRFGDDAIDKAGIPPDHPKYAVKNYLKMIAHDPDSVTDVSCLPTKTLTDGAYWSVTCTYRARNTFGALIRKTSKFGFVQGEVIGIIK